MSHRPSPPLWQETRSSGCWSPGRGTKRLRPSLSSASNEPSSPRRRSEGGGERRSQNEGVRPVGPPEFCQCWRWNRLQGTERSLCPQHLPAPISPPPSGSNVPVQLERVGTQNFGGFLCLSGLATLHGGCESVWLSLPTPTSLSLLVPHGPAVSSALPSATPRQGNANASSFAWGGEDGDNPWPNLPFFFLEDKLLILN